MGKVVLENGKQVKVPLLPFTMNGQRFGVRQNVPEVGEDTFEVLTSLGYDQAKIKELTDSQVIKSN
ncbi:CoA transferase, partial [Acinetobacter baumannii]